MSCGIPLGFGTPRDRPRVGTATRVRASCHAGAGATHVRRRTWSRGAGKMARVRRDAVISAPSHTRPPTRSPRRPLRPANGWACAYGSPLLLSAFGDLPFHRRESSVRCARPAFARRRGELVIRVVNEARYHVDRCPVWGPPSGAIAVSEQDRPQRGMGAGGCDHHGSRSALAVVHTGAPVAPPSGAGTRSSWSLRS
jgi:hypothetical protein